MTQLWRAFGGLLPEFLIGGVLIIILSLFLRKRRTGSKKTAVSILYNMSIFTILLITVYPGSYNEQLPRILNVIPFKGMVMMVFHSVDASVPLRNLGFNILLFLPFGFFLSWLRENKEKLVTYVTVMGLFLSFFVEAFQYAVPMLRAADIDDMILNTAGTFLGSFLFLAVQQLFPSAFDLSRQYSKIRLKPVKTYGGYENGPK
ncbi:VanZ family protein [Metabacillus sp. GX 13764]|uniref:VanZ family protein n=1 Tax=Metabacillus kandeliae TaxID=2900151 RepID=UPI001E63AB5A|nr:VanZ family protein [Metabacillus kandeliae]MCD7034247.1 VanZ family protein [Metabacillus kandeliae]